MKKLAILFIFVSVQLNAQLDPMSQYFNQLLIPELVPYDSIAFSPDSGTAFNASLTAYQHYLPNGYIDTLVVKDNGVTSESYFGEVNGNETRVKGLEIPTKDTLDMVVFNQSANGRDSVLSYHSYVGGMFQQDFKAEFVYRNNGEIFRIKISNPFVGYLGDWRFYFDSQGKMDSIYYQVSPSGSGPGYTLFTYDAAGMQLLEIESFEDVNNDGEMIVINRQLMRHNANNQVTAIIEFEFNPSTQGLDLVGEYRYLTHSASRLGRMEENALEAISIYPVPASDVLHLNESDFEGDYQIIDTQGKVVLRGRVPDSPINVSALKTGFYFLNITARNERSTRGFMKL